MSKNRNKKKNKETVTIDISDIINTLQLKDQDIEELNKYINKGLTMKTNDYLSNMSSDENLTKNKLIFLSYMRGTIEQQHQSYSGTIFRNDLDASSKIMRGFSGHNIEDICRILTNTLQTMMIETIKDPEDISSYLHFLSEYFEKCSSEWKNRTGVAQDIMKLHGI